MNTIAQGKEEAKRVLEEKYKRYKKLPPENITDEEWNVFFDVLRDHLNKKDIMDDYLNAIHVIMERALFYASVKQSKDFNINHLTRALEELVAFNIFRDEIKDMKKEVNSYLDPNTKEYKLRKLVENAVNESCKKWHRSIPDYISINDWIAVLNIFEAHYIANQKMYIEETLDCFVKSCIYWADVFNDPAKLFKHVRGSDTMLDSYDNVIRYRDGEAIEEEIDDKIKLKIKNKIGG